MLVDGSAKSTLTLISKKVNAQRDFGRRGRCLVVNRNHRSGYALGALLHEPGTTRSLLARGTAERAWEIADRISDTALPDVPNEVTGLISGPAETASRAVEPKVGDISEQAQRAGNGMSNFTSATGSASQAAGSAIDNASSGQTQAADNAVQFSSFDATGRPSLLERLTDAVNDASKSVSNAAINIRDSLSASISGGQESISGSRDEIERQVQGLTTGLSRDIGGATGGALQDASSALESLKGAATGIAEDLSNEALQQANTSIDTLPEPLREIILAIWTQVAEALQVPALRNTALVVAVGYPTYLWFTARFGGFSGRLSPLAARKMLENDNALLLDVRSEIGRETAGIPELQRGARGKGLAFPLVQVVKAKVLPFQVAALLVNGLYKVSNGTKIIVLSDSETQAVKLARALTEDAARKAYILKDGVTGWVAAGLPISEDTEYESGPLAGIGGTVEGRLLPFLRSPITAIGAIFLSLALSAILIDEHKTLQFIGAFGLTFTIGSMPVRYNSLQEARDDVFGPLIKFYSTISNLVPKNKSPATPGPDLNDPTSSVKSLQSPEEAAYDDRWEDTIQKKANAEAESQESRDLEAASAGQAVSTELKPQREDLDGSEKANAPNAQGKAASRESS